MDNDSSIESRLAALEKQKLQPEMTHPTHWAAVVPGWLFGASFAIVAIVLLVLFFTGKKITYSESQGFGFEDPNPRTQIKAPRFGKFQTVQFNKVEQAEVDGLILATLTAHENVGGVARLEVIADKTLNPEELRGAQSITAHPQSNWARGQGANLLVPVGAGEYYKVQVTGPMAKNAYSVKVMFVPFE